MARAKKEEITEEVVNTTEDTITEETTEDTKTVKVNFVYPKECKIKRRLESYLNSKKYINYRDILTAILSKDEEYTEAEVVNHIETYLNKGVK